MPTLVRAFFFLSRPPPSELIIFFRREVNPFWTGRPGQVTSFQIDKEKSHFLPLQKRSSEDSRSPFLITIPNLSPPCFVEIVRCLLASFGNVLLREIFLSFCSWNVRGDFVNPFFPFFTLPFPSSCLQIPPLPSRGRSLFRNSPLFCRQAQKRMNDLEERRGFPSAGSLIPSSHDRETMFPFHSVIFLFLRI